MAKKFVPSVDPSTRYVQVGVAPTVVTTCSSTVPVRPPRSMMLVVGTFPVSAVHRLTGPGEYGAPTSTARVATHCLLGPVPAAVMHLAPAASEHRLLTFIDRA